ncbi:arsB [Symbiodinium natans]|uniref:ArsB protein n=1 Tax=Symbiodinium natans TaxID=878477 RepID=A0A812QFM5_9DINO|nr:arsB [Symbiodinium natans]
MVPSTDILEQQPTTSRISADVEAAKHQFERCESSASTEVTSERFPRFSSDSSCEPEEPEVSQAERKKLEHEEHGDEKAELFREFRATPVIALLLLLFFVCYSKPIVLLWLATLAAFVVVIPNVTVNLHLMFASQEDL